MKIISLLDGVYLIYGSGSIDEADCAADIFAGYIVTEKVTGKLQLSRGETMKNYFRRVVCCICTVCIMLTSTVGAMAASADITTGDAAAAAQGTADLLQSEQSAAADAEKQKKTVETDSGSGEQDPGAEDVYRSEKAGLFSAVYSEEYGIYYENGKVTGAGDGVIDIVIPESIDGQAITSIGNRAFEENQNLRMVVIPDTVTEIGAYAFYRCTGLKELTLEVRFRTAQE